MKSRRSLKRLMQQALGVLLSVMSLLTFMPGAARTAAAANRTVSVATYQWSAPGIKDWFEAVAAAFEKQYPDVTVKREVVPVSEYWDKMILQIKAGSTPDLMQVDGITHQLIADGALEPLDRWLKNSDIPQRWHPLQNILTRNGQTYALIYSMSNWSTLFYNKDLFKAAGVQPPKTIDELYERAVQLTKGGVFGFSMPTQQNPDDQLLISLSGIVYLFGGAWADNGVLTLNSPAVIKGVTFFKKLYDAKVSPIGMDMLQRRQMQVEGKIAMFIEGPFSLRQYFQDPAWKDRLGAMMPPSPVPEKDRKLMAQFSAFAIPKAAKNKEDAWKFIEVASRHEFQEKVLELTLQSPGEKGVTSAKVAAEFPVMRTSWEIDKYATRLRYPEGLEEFYPAFRRTVAKYVAQIMLQNRDVAQAMADAQKEAEEIVAKTKR